MNVVGTEVKALFCQKFKSYCILFLIRPGACVINIFTAVILVIL
jgi:hypothetical protein